MAIITTIDAAASISLAPAIINTNFTNINNELAGFANLVAVASSSIALNGVVAAPTKGIEAAAIILTGAAGNLINGFPSGATSVFSVTVSGEIIGLKMTLSAIETSEMGGANFNGVTLFKEQSTFEKAIVLTGDAVYVSKHSRIDVVSGNIGASATSPLQVNDKMEILFDASNGATELVPIGSDATVNIDVSTLIVGQILTFRLLAKNATNSLKMLNGDAVAPLFSKIDYTAGYTDIAYTVYPEFDDTTSGNAWMTCQWVEITAGNFRLVILDSQNILNV